MEWESPIPRRGAVMSLRAKSFRDRLDPLLGKELYVLNLTCYTNALFLLKL